MYRPWIVVLLAEYYDSQPADYPKLAATLKAAKRWGQPVETGK